MAEGNLNYDPSLEPNQQVFSQQQYAQPTQQMPYDPAQQQAYAQQPYDPNQQVYGQPQYGQPMYGQPQYGQPVYGQPGVAPYAQGSNPGTTPMVLGILSIVFVGLVGLILSIIGIKKAGPVLAADPNNGRAKAGKVTGIIGLILSILAIVISIVMFVGVFVAASSMADDPEGFISTLEDIAAQDETGQLQSEIDELKQEMGITEGSGDSAGAADAGTDTPAISSNDALFKGV